MERGAGATNRSAMARPQARRRLPAAGRWRGHSHHPIDARAREHSADATLPERNGRRTSERLGGELEEPGSTAPAGIGPLTRLVSPPDCPDFVPFDSKEWLLRLDSNQ